MEDQKQGMTAIRRTVQARMRDFERPLQLIFEEESSFGEDDDADTDAFTDSLGSPSSGRFREMQRSSKDSMNSLGQCSMQNFLSPTNSRKSVVL